MIDFMLYEDARESDQRMIVINHGLMKLIQEKYSDDVKFAEEEFKHQHNDNVEAEEGKDDFMENLFNRNLSQCKGVDERRDT